MMIDSVPPLVSPDLLFPVESLDQIPDLADSFHKFEDNLFDSQVELQVIICKLLLQDFRFMYDE